MDNGNGAAVDMGPKELGIDPASGLKVSLRQGPYGQYVQLGENIPAPPKEKRAKGEKRPKGEKAPKAEKPPKPKRASLPKGIEANDVDLAKALALLALPRDVGAHPEDRPDDHRRHRPLRPLSQARARLQIAGQGR